jgi:hypothetical protein
MDAINFKLPLVNGSRPLFILQRIRELVSVERRGSLRSHSRKRDTGSGITERPARLLHSSGLVRIHRAGAYKPQMLQPKRSFVLGLMFHASGRSALPPRGFLRVIVTR